ncbi:hypothetical protein BDD43_1040 [Mucilaginibacter gracilis]|uniref:Immunity protein 17 of polymorphic toxin system n=1 Tax=Mucilaginibacter gracilis TaxID=423350 RepID=A0A495IWM0_9SPHI|nr:hypothetical protein BDD43_1040 [Mucilaginibacter gracilis]
MHDNSSSFWGYLTGILTASLLLFIGYFAVFKKQRFIDFYISRDPSERFKRISEKSWYKLNLNICGSACLLVGTALLIYTISCVINK